jgi:hypothetical protein
MAVGLAMSFSIARFALGLALVLETAGCASSHCGSDPEPVDAGNDAACDGASTIYLVEVPRTASTPTADCTPASRGLDARLLDASGRATGDVTITCVDGAVYRLDARPAGRYLLTLRRGTQTVAGGTLLGDTACPDPTLQMCDPIDVVVTSCAPTVVVYTLPCPVGATDCGGGA